MPVTAPRILKYREKQKAKGMRRISCALTADGNKALQTLQALNPGVPMGDIISSALIRLALDKVAQSGAREGSMTEETAGGTSLAELELIAIPFPRPGVVPTAPRILKYREKQKAKGMRRIGCALTQDGDAALRTLQALYPGVPMGDIISSALIRLALDKVEKKGAREGSMTEETAGGTSLAELELTVIPFPRPGVVPGFLSASAADANGMPWFSHALRNCYAYHGPPHRVAANEKPLLRDHRESQIAARCPVLLIVSHAGTRRFHYTATPGVDWQSEIRLC